MTLARVKKRKKKLQQKKIEMQSKHQEQAHEKQGAFLNKYTLNKPTSFEQAMAKMTVPLEHHIEQNQEYDTTSAVLEIALDRLESSSKLTAYLLISYYFKNLSQGWDEYDGFLPANMECLALAMAMHNFGSLVAKRKMVVKQNRCAIEVALEKEGVAEIEDAAPVSDAESDRDLEAFLDLEAGPGLRLVGQVKCPSLFDCSAELVGDVGALNDGA